MNLLVTGGCGFIGSNFINYFGKKYPDTLIVNIDAMYYCANENNVTLKNNYKFVRGNIQSADLVSHILEEYSITHVIHFAAQSHVQNSFDDSLKYTMDNILGTHTLLECCKSYSKIIKFIHVSTDEVYGESVDDDLKHESSVLIPTNPYAATKAGAELVAMSYIKSYKLPIIITRGNNVYGPNQYPEKLIPRFIQQLKNNQPVTIQGDGSAQRSFLHVDDTCSAFETILLNGIVGEIYNIGTNVGESEYSVLEIATILIKLIKGPDSVVEDFIEYIPDRPFNDSRYFISNQKLKNLGWTILVRFETGIKELIGFT
uniref:NAD(P)-binding domain-containing protein n=1 Tax=viral metagenome TaxID=1070528 RepID=A0A6C0I9Y1_9ZZZZ